MGDSEMFDSAADAIESMQRDILDKNAEIVRLNVVLDELRSKYREIYRTLGC